MPKLIIVSGLPGSGKTQYLKKLLLTNEIGYRCDDFHSCAQADSQCVTASRCWSELIASLERGLDCAVADVVFCLEPRREALRREVLARLPAVEVEVRCFENDPHRCRQNVLARQPERSGSLRADLQILEGLTARYVIPPGAVRLPVLR